MARCGIILCMGVALASLAIQANAETQPLAYIPAGDQQPARVELRVDGNLVVRISCDGPRRLRFDFPKDEDYQSLLPAERRKPLEFEFDEASLYVLPTIDTPHLRTGRLDLKPRVLRELDRSDLAWFWGPSDMGEPWAVLNLDALRRLARSCSPPKRTN